MAEKKGMRNSLTAYGFNSEIAEMARGSGDALTTRDASIVMGMIARGDCDHDIAAWFGVNERIIAEVKAGKHSPASVADAVEFR